MVIEIEEFPPGQPPPAFEELRQSLYPSALPPEFVLPHCTPFLARRQGAPVARLTTSVLPLGKPLGLIGHYEAQDPEAGVALLQAATKSLRDQGLSTILGPMNGNTWMRYRFAILDQRSPPPFLGEPVNLPAYPQHFLDADFVLDTTYESRIAHDLDKRHPTAQRLLDRLARKGFRVASLDMERYDELLQNTYQLSLEAFTENLYYTPIPFELFAGMYQKLKPLLDPDLVRLVYNQKDQVVAFALAYPDLDKKQAIFKTLACAREVRALGLGIALLDDIHRIAHQKGYERMIHALMHSEHNSLKLSARAFGSQPFRRYELYRIG